MNAASATLAHSWRASTSVSKTVEWGCPDSLYLILVYRPDRVGEGTISTQPTFPFMSKSV